MARPRELRNRAKFDKTKTLVANRPISSLNGKAYERGQTVDTEGKYAPSIQVLKRMWASHRLVYQDEYKPIPTAEKADLTPADKSDAQIDPADAASSETDAAAASAGSASAAANNAEASATGTLSSEPAVKAEIDQGESITDQGKAETPAFEAKAKPKAKSKKSGKKKAG